MWKDHTDSYVHLMAILAQREVEYLVKVRSYGNENIYIESELLLYVCKKGFDLVWAIHGIIVLDSIDTRPNMQTSIRSFPPEYWWPG